MNNLPLTIERDGLPPIGTWVLAQVEQPRSSWTDYKVLFYGYHKGVSAPHFMLYDLLVPKRQIISYQIIEKAKFTTLE